MTASPVITRLFLVRHGGTTAGADRFAGSTDVSLSDEGRLQARALAERLASIHVSAAYASDLRRATETAEVILRRQRSPGLTLQPLAAVREIAHGRWENLAIRDVKLRFREEYARYEADPLNAAPEGGETGASVLARALPAVQSVVARHAGGAVLIVSHKATIRLVLCGLLGIDPTGYRDRLRQDLACLNIVDFRGPDGPQLVLMNDTSHYAALA